MACTPHCAAVGLSYPGPVKPSPCVLTINGGSSSIRFAVHEAGDASCPRLAGKIDRIGLSGTTLAVVARAGVPGTVRRLAAGDHRTAVGHLLDWLGGQEIFASIRAVGHRVVHGMKHAEPERITLYSTSPSATLVALMKRTDEAGLALGELQVRQGTLEDVFLKLTGRRIRE